MRILIIFGTTEGHTRDLCQFAAECLREVGHETTVEEAPQEGSGVLVDGYDAVILAASLHVGRFQGNLLRFAQAYRATLNAKPSAFISVSLSAAGENPDDWEGLEQCVAGFLNETGWTPKAVHHAAGAIRYSQYDFFKRLALKHIAAKRGKHTVTSRDYDLTDYDALREFVLRFVDSSARASEREESRLQIPWATLRQPPLR